MIYSFSASISPSKYEASSEMSSLVLSLFVMRLQFFSFSWQSLTRISNCSRGLVLVSSGFFEGLNGMMM